MLIATAAITDAFGLAGSGGSAPARARTGGAAAAKSEHLPPGTEYPGQPGPINTSFPGLTTFRGNATRNYYGEGPLPKHPQILWQYPQSGGHVLDVERPVRDRGRGAAPAGPASPT